MTLAAGSQRCRMAHKLPACLLALVFACEPASSSVDLGGGLTSSDDTMTVAVDSLPIWTSTVDLTIGLDPRPGDDFLMPDPLGADEAGRIYVIDPRQQEIRRFDATGQLDDIVVRPGQGPREMAFFPLTYGLTKGLLWFSEFPTGKLHFIPTVGGEAFTEDTGLTAARFGVQAIEITPELGRSSYLVHAEPYDRYSFGLRPTIHVQYFRAYAGKLDTLLHYRTPSSNLRLDEGRTSVRYLGPSDDTVVLYDSESARFLKIDRPVVPGARNASVLLQWLTDLGAVVTARELLVPAIALQPAERDLIERALVLAASFDGRRTIGSDLKRDLGSLVAAIPDRLPAFDEAVFGWSGTIWLRLNQPDGQLPQQEWLVLDRSLDPIARALTPRHVVKMAFREDGSWWATMKGALEVYYVGRLVFDTATAH